MNQTINLANLVDICEGITGRKKLQKIVHLLQEFGHIDDFGYDFGYLHYGPYSRSLRDDLDLLVGCVPPIIAEQSELAGAHETFKYAPSAGLREALNGAGVNDTPPWKSLARKLNALAPQKLEAMSTIRFLSHQGFDGAALKERFAMLKPSLASQFDSAVSDLRSFTVQDVSA